MNLKRTNLQGWINLIRLTIRKKYKALFRHALPITFVGVDENQNSGMCYLYGDAKQLSQKTVIVLGLERGGTSMVAGALARMGVYMGKTISAVHEDPEFAHFLRSKNKKSAKELILMRNESHDVWGLKKTSRHLRKPSWIKLFREPVFVVVCRDMMAISSRRSTVNGVALYDGINDAIVGYKDIIRCIRRHKRPTMIVSYEKVLHKPEIFAHALADFIGKADSNSIETVIDFIEPTPKAYIDATRNRDSWRGMLERLSESKVTGWSFKIGSLQPVTVVITLPDGQVLTTIANKSRLDVQRYHHHVSEFSGFELELPSASRFNAGDCVTAHIESEIEQLNNSPMTFTSSS